MTKESEELLTPPSRGLTFSLPLKWIICAKKRHENGVWDGNQNLFTCNHIHAPKIFLQDSVHVILDASKERIVSKLCQSVKNI